MTRIAGGILLVLACLVSLAMAGGEATPTSSQAAKDAGTYTTLERGSVIYATQCAACHGEKGQGVEGSYEQPLSGDRTLDWLTRRIERTMPEGESHKCVGEDAAAVAAYLHHAFYKNSQPAQRTLQRLTIEQHRQSLADLIGSFREANAWSAQRGLWTQVYRGRDMRKKDEALSEHISAALDATYSPEHHLYEDFDPKGHSVRWGGSLLVDETGEYEIVVRTDQAMRLWINDGRAVGGGIRNEITDTQDVAFLDGWLQSKDKTEFRRKVFFIAGRAYPLMLEFSAHNQGVGSKQWQDKFKGEQTSYVSLSWVPPGGVEQVIPERHLMPKRTPEVFVVSNPFPPDDASMGFISGAEVSEAWLSAATQAAVYTAGYVVDHLHELAATKPQAPNYRQDVIRFCEVFVGRTFRRPLTPAEKQRQVHAHFASGQGIEPAVKRVVLAALLSPRFLYPQARGDVPDAFDVATSLALAMWDSLPDQALLDAAANGGLENLEQLEAHARRMLDNPRAKAKLMGFFYHWLELERAEHVDKDKGLFPEFNLQLFADLRTSLDLLLENTVFSTASDYRELLLADDLYVNDSIAEVYGIDRGEDVGKGFTRTPMPNDRRSGVITHPYLLTAFAYHNSTSPIHRGVFLTRNIVGLPLNPPPNAIAFEDAEFDPTLTMREKVTAFTRDPACMACHATINPLGFSLENYDSIGRWRTQELGQPINAASEFIGENGQTLQFNGARDVALYAVESNTAHRAFIRLLFQHTAQRDPSALSPDLLDQLTSQFQAGGFHIRNLFARIAVETASAELHSEHTQETP
ncbi:MAG: DUF1592 domain-containing protein [Planctomycetota bacterium]